jgi:hypothetical protein
MSKSFKKLITEMNEIKQESPRNLVSGIHHSLIHNQIHLPISKEITNLGFFTNKPTHKDGVADFSINGSHRGSEILTHQLGIGRSLIPIPQHHPMQEHSVKHLVERAFGKKPSKYLKYLRVIHDGLSSVIEQHRQHWANSHKEASQTLRAMKAATMTSLNSSIPIGKTIETHQLKAHHHAELAAEHERFIREMELHKKTIVRHAHALGQIFGVDSRLSSEMNVNSPKIVSGIWDEVL